MQTRDLGAEPGRRWLLVLDKGDEVLTELRRFAEASGIRGGTFTALGAFSTATLAYFDRERREYLPIPVEEQVEVAAMVGNIAVHDGAVKVHAHAVLSRRDGTAVAGHVLEGRVWPTLELALTVAPGGLERRIDAESGLPLLN